MRMEERRNFLMQQNPAQLEEQAHGCSATRLGPSITPSAAVQKRNTTELSSPGLFIQGSSRHQTSTIHSRSAAVPAERNPPPSHNKVPISSKSWSLKGLLEQGKQFKEVQRISARSPLLLETMKYHDQMGEPLIVDKLHCHPQWPTEIFKVDWLLRNSKHETIVARNVLDRTDKNLSLASFIDQARSAASSPSLELRELLYNKDAQCPPEWEDWVNNSPAIPESLRPGGECDLFKYLPATENVESLMCYLGIADTFTPCHKDLCASSGHNIMCYTEGDGSSFWFMTKSCDAPIVSRYFQRKVKKELDWEEYAVTVEEFAQAPFTVYVAEQKLGDMVLVPPRSCHQVVNHGGLTVKTSWSRMTVQGLITAYYHELPMYRRVCRPEQYRIKSVLFYSMIRIAAELQIHFQSEPEASMNDCHKITTDLQSLVTLFDCVLHEEYTKHHEDLPHLLSNYHPPAGTIWQTSGLTNVTQAFYPSASHPEITVRGQDEYTEESKDTYNLMCDFCGADIFQSFMECKNCVHNQNSQGLGNGFLICPSCYTEGRTCACGQMIAAQLHSFEVLLQARNNAQTVLSKYVPSLVKPLQEIDLRTSDSLLIFEAAYNLMECRKAAGEKLEGTRRCRTNKVHPHAASWASVVPCSECHSAICYPHLLRIGVHSAQAILVNHQKNRIWHQFHKHAKAEYEQARIKEDQAEENGSPSILHNKLVKMAQTYPNCQPVNPEFSGLGWYDTMGYDCEIASTSKTTLKPDSLSYVSRLHFSLSSKTISIKNNAQDGVLELAGHNSENARTHPLSLSTNTSLTKSPVTIYRTSLAPPYNPPQKRQSSIHIENSRATKKTKAVSGIEAINATVTNGRMSPEWETGMGAGGSSNSSLAAVLPTSHGKTSKATITSSSTPGRRIIYSSLSCTPEPPVVTPPSPSMIPTMGREHPSESSDIVLSDSPSSASQSAQQEQEPSMSNDPTYWPGPSSSKAPLIARIRSSDTRLGMSPSISTFKAPRGRPPGFNAEEVKRHLAEYSSRRETISASTSREKTTVSVPSFARSKPATSPARLPSSSAHRRFRLIGPRTPPSTSNRSLAHPSSPTTLHSSTVPVSQDVSSSVSGQSTTQPPPIPPEVTSALHDAHTMITELGTHIKFLEQTVKTLEEELHSKHDAVGQMIAMFSDIMQAREQRVKTLEEQYLAQHHEIKCIQQEREAMRVQALVDDEQNSAMKETIHALETKNEKLQHDVDELKKSALISQIHCATGEGEQGSQAQKGKEVCQDVSVQSPSVQTNSTVTLPTGPRASVVDTFSGRPAIYSNSALEETIRTLEAKNEKLQHDVDELKKSALISQIHATGEGEQGSQAQKGKEVYRDVSVQTPSVQANFTVTLPTGPRASVVDTFNGRPAIYPKDDFSPAPGGYDPTQRVNNMPELPLHGQRHSDRDGYNRGTHPGYGQPERYRPRDTPYMTNHRRHPYSRGRGRGQQFQYMPTRYPSQASSSDSRSQSSYGAYQRSSYPAENRSDQRYGGNRLPPHVNPQGSYPAFNNEFQQNNHQGYPHTEGSPGGTSESHRSIALTDAREGTEPRNGSGWLQSHANHNQIREGTASSQYQVHHTPDNSYKETGRTESDV